MRFAAARIGHDADAQRSPARSILSRSADENATRRTPSLCTGVLGKVCDIHVRRLNIDVAHHAFFRGHSTGRRGR